MKGLTIIILILVVSSSIRSFAQPQKIISEIGEWKLEEDEKSRWEFKSNGKLHFTYLGTNSFHSFTYEILTSKPVCPDVQLAVEPNVKYLKIVNDNDGDVRCFYIYALNNERLTLMDALSGKVAPFIRVE